MGKWQEMEAHDRAGNIEKADLDPCGHDVANDETGANTGPKFT
jgi:hypothetical protein